MIQSPLTLLKTFRLIAIFVLVLLSTLETVSAQPYTLSRTFDDPTATNSQNFGSSVAIDGNHVLIGARNGNAFGQAHLFDATSGELLLTFDDPTPSSNDQFGVRVALDGNRALIGARHDDTHGLNFGQAHLFDVTSGSLLHTFDDPTPIEGGRFGASVAIVDNHVVIGAPWDSDSAGQVHLFDANSGSLLRTFDPPAQVGPGLFGRRIAVHGNRILISAPGPYLTETGQVHLFDSTTGALLRTFDDPTPTDGDSFGFTVALDEARVLIGAPGDDTNGDGVGQAHLFDVTTGDLVQTFNGLSPTPTDFGMRVALDGNHVLIGAPDYTNGVNVGQAYLFEATTGDLLWTFDDPTPTDLDRFGTAVALDANRVLISAQRDDTNAVDVGQAHLFKVVTDGDFNDDGFFDCADVDGLVMEIAAGSHDPAFDLTGDGVVNLSDLDEWRTQGGAANLPSGNPYLEGDANLDGTVDGADFFAWNNHKFTNVAGWCSADFNADGIIDGDDFLLWNANKFLSADGVSAVPEPSFGILMTAALMGLGVVRRR